jgi:hypothetical protein
VKGSLDHPQTRTIAGQVRKGKHERPLESIGAAQAHRCRLPSLKSAPTKRRLLLLTVFRPDQQGGQYDIKSATEDYCGAL